MLIDTKTWVTSIHRFLPFWGKRNPPGDSMWPFDPPVGGHPTNFEFGSLNLKRSPAELPGARRPPFAWESCSGSPGLRFLASFDSASSDHVQTTKEVGVGAYYTYICKFKFIYIYRHIYNIYIYICVYIYILSIYTWNLWMSSILVVEPSKTRCFPNQNRGRLIWVPGI